MPLSRYQRLEWLKQMFTDVSLSSPNSIGSFVGFATGDPGDDAGNSDTGTTQNESTVTVRSAFSGGSWTITSGPDIHGNYLAYSANEQQSCSGSAVLSYWYMSTTSSTGTKHNWWEQFPSPVNVTASDFIRFAPHRCRFRFDSVVSNYWAFSQDGGLLEFGLGSPLTVDGLLNLYMALSSTPPYADGTNVTEPTGGAYARALVDTSGSGIMMSTQWIGFGSTNIAQAYNSSAITFPTATGSWSGLTHWALYSASTGGNMCFYGALDSTVNVLTGETPSFLVNDFQVNMPP